MAIVVALFTGTILPLAILAYGAYWGFAIRRGLVGHIYRNQALWLGAFCIYNSVAVLGFLSGVVNIAFLGLSAVVYLGLVDSMIPVARRSDPLSRNILHWGKVRIGLWVLIGITLPFYLYSNVIDSSSVIASSLFVPLFVPLIAVGTLALLIGARRSRDPILRGTLKWVGIFFLCEAAQVFAFVLASGLWPGVVDLSNSELGTYLSFSFPSIPSALFVDLGFYALYRSTRSLVPIYRLLPIEPD